MGMNYAMLWQIKITDFGLAKSSDDSGGLKTFCGTPHYFAPEVQNQQPAGQIIPNCCHGHIYVIINGFVSIVLR